MLTLPFNDFRCVKRLLDEYYLHHNLLVAFDYDNTVYDYHGKGEDYSLVIDLLKRCKKLGMVLILFTVEESEEDIVWKKHYLERNGLVVDYVNKSPVYPNAKKPYYNILLDDRAGLESAVRQLAEVCNQIEKHNEEFPNNV